MALESSESFGARVRRLAAERGWKVPQLAKRVGIDRTHLHRMLKGERPWQMDHVTRIAAEFGTSLSDLAKDTDASTMIENDARLITAEHLRQLTEARSQTAALEADKFALKAELERVSSELAKARTAQENVVALAESVKRVTRERDGALTRLSRANDNWLGERGKRAVAERTLGATRLELNSARGLAEKNRLAASFWQSQAGQATAKNVQAERGAKLGWSMAALGLVTALASKET